jgi:hypothetical protein
LTRFRKALLPLLLGCAGGLAHSQAELAPEATVRRFAGIVDAASRKHGVDGALVHALIFVESSYDPRAVSPQGALGLMQLMPETARRYGVRDALDPAQNVDGGVRMLKDLLEHFDQDVELALAAYNSGTSAVVRAGYRVPEYDETLAFVPRVMGYYAAYRTLAEPPRATGGARLEAIAGLDYLRRAIEPATAPALAPPADPDGSEHGKRPVAIASTRRARRRAAARIFGTGAATRLPEPNTNRSTRRIGKRKAASGAPRATTGRSRARKGDGGAE